MKLVKEQIFDQKTERVAQNVRKLERGAGWNYVADEVFGQVFTCICENLRHHAMFYIKE